MPRSEDLLKKRIMARGGEKARTLVASTPSGEPLAKRALDSGLVSADDLIVLLDDLAEDEKKAGNRAAAESVLFGKSVVLDGKASVLEVWNGLKAQEEERAKGRERSIDVYLGGTFDTGFTMGFLRKGGKDLLACRDCGRREIVTGEDKTGSFTCPECGGVLLPADQVKRTTLEQSEGKDPLVGQTVGGCRLEKKLGQGGMGYVYKALHLALNKPVAIKFLSENINNENARKRFLKEARAAARLEHANIVAVHDTGVDQGRHYIIMQFIEGESVSAKLKREGALPVPEALRIGVEAARGIAAAHHTNMVHRDIKPDNLMLDPRGAVKVADFGLAKDLTDESGLTMSQQAMGTPHYMSPEQAGDARSAGPRSDIYSFGATLYAMLAGAPPFQGTTPWAIITKHQNEPLPDLREKNPAVPERLWRAVRKMMEKKIEDRFPDMDAVIEELLEIQRELAKSLAPAAEAKGDGAAPARMPESSATPATLSPPAPAAAVAPPGFAESNTPVTIVPVPPPKGSAVPVLGIVAVLAVVGLVAAVLAMSGAFSGERSPEAAIEAGPGAVQGGKAAPPPDGKKPDPGTEGGKPSPPEPGTRVPGKTEPTPGPGKGPANGDLEREAEKALAALMETVSGFSAEGKYEEAVGAFDAFPERFLATRSGKRIEMEKATVAVAAVAQSRKDLGESDALSRQDRAAEARDRLDRDARAMAALARRWPGAEGVEGWKATVEALASKDRAFGNLAVELEWIAGVKARLGSTGDADLLLDVKRLEDDAGGAVAGSEKKAGEALAAVREEQGIRGARREKEGFAAAEAKARERAESGKFSEALEAVEPFLNSGNGEIKASAAGCAAEVRRLKAAWDRFGETEEVARRHLDAGTWSGLRKAAEAFGEYFREGTPEVLSGKAAAKLEEIEAERRGRIKAFEAEGYRFVEGGEVRLGSEDPLDRNPSRAATLESFLIGGKEVTNAEYAKFAGETGRPAPRHWKDGQVPEGLADHPVTFVSAEDARAFCEWAGRASGKTVRLPTADEWEAAAGWNAESRKMSRFPWGDGFAKENANLESGATSPAGAFPADRSPCGALDMAGNVSEWALSSDPSETERFSACGGCCEDRGAESAARNACRQPLPADTRGKSLGFRVVRELD